MDTRREFLKKAGLLSGAGFIDILPASIARALAIDPVAGSTYLDAEHIVFLMQENRSFDHTYGTLQGVRGFNDPRAITLPDKNLVWLQSNAQGETYCPFRLNMKDTKATWMSSLPHSWSNQVDARNNGKYDKWLDVKGSGHEEYKGMPLTMGFYNRIDIPFYYALTDAFTVCDHNFCSSLTGTTPNRLYFWSGTIREKPEASSIANVWNGDADYDTPVSWKTYPERLEENGISWKVYQNEISVGVGFEGEEDAWLANFTDNPLEFFTQYQVKLSVEFIKNLPGAEKKIRSEIDKTETQLKSLTESSSEAQKMKKRLDSLKAALKLNLEDQKNFTLEKYQQLSQHEKNLHDKAFSNNRKDPSYHALTTVQYDDGNIKRELQVPKGDTLFQFREDVKNGELPTVSWIVAPENYSDHPGAAWYGAWYISEVMDILTKNPEVWKKTIFILTYDENDGYFDHMPPFVAPEPGKKETGHVSEGIDTGIEFVRHSQQSAKNQSRESSIGLGYRVPLVIASPWSRGGWVNSEVFDHTSSLMFLEKFLEHKGKKVTETNISEWRRTICGDLSSVFRPYNGEKLTALQPVNKDEFIQSIHRAQFKGLPSDYKKLSAEEIKKINTDPYSSGLMPVQEKGIRSANSLPYELYADGRLSADKKSFEVSFSASSKSFGKNASGAPFNIYAPGKFNNETIQARSYAVKSGDTLTDQWLVSQFENDLYFLRVYGPNGFYREFKGNQDDPSIEIQCGYEPQKKSPDKYSGNLIILIKNAGKETKLDITDNAYRSPKRLVTIGASQKNVSQQVVIDLSKNYNWYDFTITIPGNNNFSRRYAGHVETGNASKTDPFMGRIV